MPNVQTGCFSSTSRKQLDTHATCLLATWCAYAVLLVCTARAGRHLCHASGLFAVQCGIRTRRHRKHRERMQSSDKSNDKSSDKRFGNNHNQERGRSTERKITIACLAASRSGIYVRTPFSVESYWGVFCWPG